MRTILVITALLLVVLITAEWSLLPGEPDLSESTHLQRQTIQPVESSATPVFRLPALRVYREIEQRPLFSKKRRAGTSPSHHRLLEDSTPYPARLVLQAVLITPQTRNAFLYDREQDETLNVHLHEQVQGWIVTEIIENRVIFSKSGHQILLTLQGPAPDPKRDSPEFKQGIDKVYRRLE